MEIVSISKIDQEKPEINYNRLLPTWQPLAIKAAGLANILIGAWWVMAPFTYCKLIGIGMPELPQAWLIFGMLSVLYGLVYMKISAISADYWPVILFGLFGKLLTPLAFQYYQVDGNNWMWAIMFVTDLIWIPIFLVLLYQVGKAHQDVSAEQEVLTYTEAIKKFKDQKGQNLQQISTKTPVLVVFLRHFGCSFCKEALYDLSQKAPEIAAKGTDLVFVHMASRSEAQEYLKQYGLSRYSQISDPTCSLYRAFELKRAGFLQVFGPKAWWRATVVLLNKKQGVGKLIGDGFQMPGIFLLKNGEIVHSYRHQQVADLPPYESLATCPV